MPGEDARQATPPRPAIGAIRRPVPAPAAGAAPARAAKRGEFAGLPRLEPKSDPTLGACPASSVHPLRSRPRHLLASFARPGRGDEPPATRYATKLAAANSAAQARTASKRSVMSAELGVLSVRRKGKRALPVTASRNKSPRSHSRANCAFNSFGPVHVTAPTPAWPAASVVAFCARYSSMVRLRSFEARPPSLCTKPTLATNGSMMWIFCSGVTISSCRLSCWNSSRP